MRTSPYIEGCGKTTNMRGSAAVVSSRGARVPLWVWVQARGGRRAVGGDSGRRAGWPVSAARSVAVFERYVIGWLRSAVGAPVTA